MKRLAEVTPISSVGPGWRSKGANLGTDAVVKPDPIETARAWAAAKVGRLTAPDRVDWETHATRSGVDPEDIVRAWTYLINRPRNEAVIDRLRAVFGEAALTKGWGGYWIPTQGLMGPTKRQVQPGDEEFEQPEDMAPNQQKKQRLVARYENIYTGTIKTTRAPEVGNAPGQTTIANETPPSFPFATESANRVWIMAQHLILLHPEAQPPEIMRLAMEAARISIVDLTPEDLILLQMAIQFLQNGPPRTNVRIGGMPGGPFRSTGYMGAP